MFHKRPIRGQQGFSGRASHAESLYRDLPYGRWIGNDGTAWLFNRKYVPIWRKRPDLPAESISGSPRDPWVDFAEQHWFFGDGNSPFRRTAAARKIRQDLEEVLQEFRSGDFNGPVAQLLIARTGKAAS